jgi:hypothetical protein
MATTAQYTAQPIIEYAQLTTLDTALNNPTTAPVLICSGPAVSAANGVGKRILRVSIVATATTTATTIRFFISTDNGTNKRLLVEKIVPAVTVTAGTTPVPRQEVPELVGLVLPGGTGASTCSIYATTSVTANTNIIVESGTL